MLEEAHESNEDSKRSMLAFLVGFVLFTLVSVGLETVVAGSDSAPSNHPDSQTR